MSQVLQDAFVTGLFIGLTTLVVLFMVSLVRDIRVVLKGKE
jgi:hypothetical protein